MLLPTVDIWVASSVVSGVCMFVAMFAYRRDKQVSSRVLKQRNETIAELAKNAGTLHAAVKEQTAKRETAERERAAAIAARETAERERETAEQARQAAEARVVELERAAERRPMVREDPADLLGAVSEALVFAIDRGGRWSFLTPAWEALTGWPVTESLGRQTEEHVAPEDREEWLEFQRSLLASEHESGTGMVRLTGADGALYWLEVQIRGVTDDLGVVTALSGMFADVTKRVQAERALQRQQAVSRLLADGASDVVLLVSEAGRVTYVSPSSHAILGYQPKELIAADPLSLVDDEHRGRAAELAAMARAGTPIVEVVRFARADGQEVWLEVSAAATTDPATGAPTFRLRARDITELRAAQDALALSRAPVGRRAEAAGGAAPTADLNAVARACVAEQRLAAGGSAIEWRVETPSTLARAVVDAEGLGRGLRALLDRARYVLADTMRPVVTVRTEVEGDDVRLVVSDNAAAMSAAELMLAWDSFVGADAQVSGGNLASLHFVLRAHQGRVEAQSVVGVGTTLVITLPRARDAERGRDAASRRDRGTTPRATMAGIWE